MNILVVEDDIILGELLQDCLLRLDHEKVQVCNTGCEACNAIEADAFDCAFIDLRLPDTNGLVLLDTFKKQDPGLPVVMMSGFPTLEYTIEAMRKGASDFLTKPFTLQDVAITLERIAKEKALLLENLTLKLEFRSRKELEKVNRELQHKMEEHVRLFTISREIDEIRSSEDLYSCIVRLASCLESVEKAGFFVIPPDRGNLLPMAYHGWDAGTPLPSRFELPVGRLKEFMGNGANHILVQPEELHREFVKEVRLDNSLSCWLMRIRGEPFGVLTAFHSGRHGALPSSEVRLFDFLIRKAGLAVENMALYESLSSNFYGILKSLVNALEAKDLYTGKHSERVTQFATKIACAIGCTGVQIEALQTIGYLHDIGKIGVHDSILNKVGNLSAEEFEAVKKHPSIGDSIVAELGLSAEERSIIRHHHERWDGQGYPDGLAGQSIPLLARIVSIADAYDAMTSKRAYRGAMSREDSIFELSRNRGRQFDPGILDAFIQLIEQRAVP